MSNRRKPRPDSTWLLCPDCNSEVHEVWRGHPPRATLSIKVEHSETCPVWSEPGRELAVAFLPKAAVREAACDE